MSLVKVGPAGADVAVRRDELLHSSAFAAQLRIRACCDDNAGAALLGTLGKGIDHRQMRHILRGAAVDGWDVLQRVEVLAPVEAGGGGVELRERRTRRDAVRSVLPSTAGTFCRASKYSRQLSGTLPGLAR